jgi:secondary thiamine-phosphate synthase enzyme
MVMVIEHEFLSIATTADLDICDLTPIVREKVQQFVQKNGCQQGQVTLLARHTTTGLIVNENEVRLLHDLKVWLKTLAPPMGHYQHNDLHLREVPPDEPINAHSHLMAIALGTQLTIPFVDGSLTLGQWQSILLVELDGPRQRSVSLQLLGL